MVERIRKGGGYPGGRLETWLLRRIQGGDLKDLPLYFPLGERVGRPPEQYARALLACLKDEEGLSDDLERVRDDGRAFRSWAESKPLEAGGIERLWPAC